MVGFPVTAHTSISGMNAPVTKVGLETLFRQLQKKKKKVFFYLKYQKIHMGEKKLKYHRLAKECMILLVEQKRGIVLNSA